MNGVSPIFSFLRDLLPRQPKAKQPAQPQTKAMRRPFLLLTYALE